jgi:mannonate dehydratase
MKLGLGLYRHMLTPENFRFARQAGASAIVAHLLSYFGGNASPKFEAATSDGQGFGVSDNRGKLWTYEMLRDLRLAVEAEGLELAAIENFDPSHWYDIVLDGPQKRQQLEDVKTMIRAAGRAGIPCIGYNFTVAGVWGWVAGPFARGGAQSVGYDASLAPEETPVPLGQLMNVTYAADAPAGNVGVITPEQHWQRLTDFLTEVVPVAEEAGVRLAAHPEDPPVPMLRGTARLIYHPDHFQRLLDVVPSHANALQFCQGAVAEMADSDIYEAIDRFSKNDNIAYVHFRNVRGKVPSYREVFVDEGDVDMFRALKIYRDNGFDGVFVPDHTPQIECAASWHAGMAYALGWMRAALTAIERA